MILCKYRRSAFWTLRRQFRECAAMTPPSPTSLSHSTFLTSGGIGLSRLRNINGTSFQVSWSNQESNKLLKKREIVIYENKSRFNILNMNSGRYRAVTLMKNLFPTKTLQPIICRSGFWLGLDNTIVWTSKHFTYWLLILIVYDFLQANWKLS